MNETCLMRQEDGTLAYKDLPVIDGLLCSPFSGNPVLWFGDDMVDLKGWSFESAAVVYCDRGNKYFVPCKSDSPYEIRNTYKAYGDQSIFEISVEAEEDFYFYIKSWFLKNITDFQAFSEFLREKFKKPFFIKITCAKTKKSLGFYNYFNGIVSEKTDAYQFSTEKTLNI